jgi:hypothetical protein
MPDAFARVKAVVTPRGETVLCGDRPAHVPAREASGIWNQFQILDGRGEEPDAARAQGLRVERPSVTRTCGRPRRADGGGHEGCLRAIRVL